MCTYRVELHSDKGHWIEVDVSAKSSAEAMAKAEAELHALNGLEWCAFYSVSQGATH